MGRKEEEDNHNFNGYQIIEGKNGEKDCPEFVLSKEEEARLSKPWRKSLIIKLLDRKIGLKALE